MNMGESEDLYEILGVPKDASPDDIKKAYRSMAMKYHPDKVHRLGDKAPQEDDVFKKIQHAYSILGDNEKRRTYDMGGLLEDFSTIEDVFAMMFGLNTYEEIGATIFMMNHDDNQTASKLPSVGIYEDYFDPPRQNNRGDIFLERNDQDNGSDDGDADDNNSSENENENTMEFMTQIDKLFSSIGSTKPLTTSKIPMDTNYKAECWLSLKDLYLGGVKEKIPYYVTSRCRTCQGFKCMMCRGVQSSQCKSCRGGCQVCMQKGIVQEVHYVEVPFEPGTPDGTIVRVPIPKRTSTVLHNQFVEVTFKHKSSESASMDENDVIIRVDITVIELFLGFETVIYLPDQKGTTIQIKKSGYFDPVGTCDFYKGYGIGREGKKGDVKVMYHVLYPPAEDRLIQKFTRLLFGKSHITSPSFSCPAN